VTHENFRENRHANSISGEPRSDRCRCPSFCHFAGYLRLLGAGEDARSKREENGILKFNVRAIGFNKTSCGYVGHSDGWQDLHKFQLDWEFDKAEDGNVAVIGEVNLNGGREFTVGIAFGNSLHGAVTVLEQSLATPFAEHRERFVDQWHRACSRMKKLDAVSSDKGTLYRTSRNLLLAHEDKTFAGALIASASIPWGNSKGDEDVGGYHLVWTRDMVNSALALLACDDTATPLRALVYLACCQQADGGFAQNFWIDGTPHWQGIQLDEVAFPNSSGLAPVEERCT
jgi:glucoamylase